MSFNQNQPSYREQVKRLTIRALVSDESLFNSLVLKGGNAFEFAGIESVRKSIDIDFSTPSSLSSVTNFSEDMLVEHVSSLLRITFSESSLIVFDVRLTKQPPGLTEDVLGDFWGGYKLTFKVIPSDVDLQNLSEQQMRQRALTLGAGERKEFSVDISHHEYCDRKQLSEVDGDAVYVYSPSMIICEKIRAICQQMDEYREIVLRDRAKPRARDFFDIHHICSQIDIDFSSDDFSQTLGSIFAVKRVPIELIHFISDRRELHREDFESVKATVGAGQRVRNFDYYVDYLVTRLLDLKP